MMEQLHERFARAALGVTGTGAVLPALDLFERAVNIGAGLAAIISGAFAALYYYRKWRNARLRD